jgi:hypothetical protein
MFRPSNSHREPMIDGMFSYCRSVLVCDVFVHHSRLVTPPKSLVIPDSKS